MQPEVSPYTIVTRRNTLLFCLVLVKLLVHLVTNRAYDFHRDELYFIVCGDHLDWGYVDHAPLVPWIARASRTFGGESLPALRFLPAVAGALGLLFTSLIARRLGAGLWGEAMAGLAYLGAPALLRSANMLCIPAFEPFYWTLCSYLVIGIVTGGSGKAWLGVGLVAGVGLMNKHTMVLYTIGLVTGLLLTEQRRQLTSGWFWSGVCVAWVVFLPNLLWQIRHDWPTVEFIRHINAGVMSRISPLEFLVGQVLYMGPINLPVWLAGLAFCLFDAHGKRFRFLGWSYVTLLVLLMLSRSKVYYLMPAYPVLFATGGVCIETFAQRRSLRWLRPALPLALAAGGLVFLPVSLPILPIERADAYIHRAFPGLVSNSYEVTGDFHDQFGWRNQADVVARAWQTLSVDEQARCALYAGNYGQASALRLFGAAHRLPPALSGHNSYWLWGPGNGPVETVIAVGVREVELRDFFEEVRQTEEIRNRHCVRFENHVPVYLCRKPKHDVRNEWWRFRKYD